MPSMRTARPVLAWVAAVLFLGLATPILCAEKTVTTPAGTTNSVGQPVKATAELAVHPHSVVVRLSNQTAELHAPEQVLRGISFRINTTKPVQANIGKSEALPRIISMDGVKDGEKVMEVPWTIHVEGNKISLDAPGPRFGIISEPAQTPGKKTGYAKADARLLAPENNPYLGGVVTIEVQFPGTPLTEDLVDLEFVWERAVGVSWWDAALTGPTTDTPPSSPTPISPELPPEFPPGVTPEPPGGVVPPAPPPPVVPVILPPDLPSIPTEIPPSQIPFVPEQPSPEPPQQLSTPEPSTFCVLTLAGVVLLGRRRRKIAVANSY